MLSNHEDSAAGFRIRGRVQGVGFRWWACREAGRLGLSGTVRNLADGSVEVRAAGEASALRAFRDTLWNGPEAALVRDIEEFGVSGDLPRPFRVLR